WRRQVWSPLVLDPAPSPALRPVRHRKPPLAARAKERERALPHPASWRPPAGWLPERGGAQVPVPADRPGSRRAWRPRSCRLFHGLVLAGEDPVQRTAVGGQRAARITAFVAA